MNRKHYVDAAKVVGLLCIVMAHVSPPGIVAQLRNFDVPLMVIVSGILAASCLVAFVQEKIVDILEKKSFPRGLLQILRG